MNTAILLGAGFSRNWGGWLADEVFDYLLSRPEISSDPTLREIVWRRSDEGFEAAFEQVQQEAVDDPASEAKQQRLNSLHAALPSMFEEMNSAFFARSSFEFQNDIGSTVRGFLARFDAIFTLNQDLLLEHHYVDNFDVSLTSPRRWSSVQVPGMRRRPVEDPMFDKSWARARWEPLPDAEYTIEPASQPFIKLHGSSNWISSKGQPLLIMGGNKPGQIQRHKILSRYAMEFQALLRRPDTRLMIIGYGFRDHNINREIAHAVYNHGLRMFVISPEGRKLSKVFASSTHSGLPMVVWGYDLEHVFQTGLAGVSQRQLREIFGGDDLEHKKVARFIEA